MFKSSTIRLAGSDTNLFTKASDTPDSRRPCLPILDWPHPSARRVQWRLAPGQALRLAEARLCRRPQRQGGRDEKPAAKDWSEQEVRLIVADYFDMLEAELLGKPSKKSDHRKALASKVQGL
jgi:hypothetical protein